MATDSPLAAVQQYIDGFNKGDIELMAATFAESAAILDGMWPLYVKTAMTHDIKTGTTESLGIRLTAQDVADAIIAAVEPPLVRSFIHQVHFPVGVQTKVSALSARLPIWVQRLLNKRLTGM